MLYIVCKAKNEIALNEQNPKFDPENWEILESVKCRSNATTKTWEHAFYPIYQKFGKKYAGKHYRLWNFKKDEIEKFVS
jgi:hypothetical protein